MAIQACPGIHFVGLRRPAERMKIRINGSGMTCVVVAVLTKQRDPADQKLAVVAAVYGVAGCAILFRGRMFPKERSAFFRMAFVTQLVGGAAFDEFIPEAAVMVVAIRAFDFAFPNRMMRLLGDLNAQVPVTGQAQFRLCRF